MSAVPANFTRLKCDGCGTVREHLSINVTASRIEAAQAGWRYAIKIDRGRHVFDACPDCKVPADFMETPR